MFKMKFTESVKGTYFVKEVCVLRNVLNDTDITGCGCMTLFSETAQHRAAKAHLTHSERAMSQDLTSGSLQRQLILIPQKFE